MKKSARSHDWIPRNYPKSHRRSGRKAQASHFTCSKQVQHHNQQSSDGSNGWCCEDVGSIQDLARWTLLSGLKFTEVASPLSLQMVAATTIADDGKSFTLVRWSANHTAQTCSKPHQHQWIRATLEPQACPSSPFITHRVARATEIDAEDINIRLGTGEEAWLLHTTRSQSTTKLIDVQVARLKFHISHVQSWSNATTSNHRTDQNELVKADWPYWPDPHQHLWPLWSYVKHARCESAVLTIKRWQLKQSVEDEWKWCSSLQLQ